MFLKTTYFAPNMPSYCIVRGCSVFRVNGDKSICLYTIPRDPKVRKQWLDICGANENIKHGYVCSQHFESTAFKRHMKYELLGLPVPRGVNRFNPGAIPTLHLPETKGDKNRFDSNTADVGMDADIKEEEIDIKEENVEETQDPLEIEESGDLCQRGEKRDLSRSPSEEFTHDMKRLWSRPEEVRVTDNLESAVAEDAGGKNGFDSDVVALGVVVNIKEEPIDTEEEIAEVRQDPLEIDDAGDITQEGERRDVSTKKKDKFCSQPAKASPHATRHRSLVEEVRLTDNLNGALGKNSHEESRGTVVAIKNEEFEEQLKVSHVPEEFSSEFKEAFMTVIQKYGNKDTMKALEQMLMTLSSIKTTDELNSFLDLASLC